MSDISGVTGSTTSSTTASTSSTSSNSSSSSQPLINFTGISSGLDTASIVQELMQIESQPKVLLQQKQLVINARASIYQDITNRMYTLKSAADDLRSITLFNGSPFAGSSDPTRLTASATANAAPGTYSVQVTAMASANVQQQHADSFVSSFGYAYAGNGVYASSSTALSTLTDGSGASLGLSAGKTITLQSTKNGKPSTATFTLSATSTLDDLRKFVQTSLPGSTVSLGQGGQMSVVSPPGDEQAYTDVGLLGPDGSALGGAGGMGTTNPPTPPSSLGSVVAHGTGTVHLVSSGIPIDIAVNDGDTMDKVASAINAKNGSVTASVVNGTLRLQARQQGATSAIQISSPDGVTLGSFDDVVAATDAAGTVNGKAFTSASNNVTTALGGVTLNLLGTTTAGNPLTVTVDPQHVDTDGIVAKVKTFVTAYNDVISTIQSKITEKTVQSPTTDADRIKGALFGDTTLQNVLDSLRDAMTDPVSGLANGLNIASSAGLSTGAIGQAYSSDAVSGKLTLDETKLRAALAGGVQNVKALFDSNLGSSAKNGLMQRISDLSFGATRTNGILQSAIAGETSEAKDIGQRIADMQIMLDQRQQTLKNEFTAMESALSQLKSNGSSLAGFTTNNNSSN